MTARSRPDPVRRSRRGARDDPRGRGRERGAGRRHHAAALGRLQGRRAARRRALEARRQSRTRSTSYGSTPARRSRENRATPSSSSCCSTRAPTSKRRTQDGQTALMLAARTGALDVAQLLVERGADVNARETWRGQTALMWAADGDFPEVVELLIANGADVHTRALANDWDRADHLRAARAVPPDRRPHAAAVCGALRLHALRARDARGRRGHQPAESRRRHAADGRARQLRASTPRGCCSTRARTRTSGTGGAARRSTSPST